MLSVAPRRSAKTGLLEDGWQETGFHFFGIMLERAAVRDEQPASEFVETKV
ncbi:hypothetical protein NB311A_03054 [Nitrobacter sp. Nb-311A]|nr:hypothetical protein NB311A_03054 [Nitrobacter sp. Nb-311A]